MHSPYHRGRGLRIDPDLRSICLGAHPQCVWCLCLYSCSSVLGFDVSGPGGGIGPSESSVLRAEEGKERECECLENTLPNIPCARLCNSEPSPSPPLCVLPSFPQHNQANIRSTRTSLVRVCWTVIAECFLGDAVLRGLKCRLEDEADFFQLMNTRNIYSFSRRQDSVCKRDSFFLHLSLPSLLT